MKILGISPTGMAALAALITAAALVGCPPELEPQGSLTVEIQPEEIREEARWIVDGEEYESGAEVELPAGEYDIEFTAPNGWTAPLPLEGVSVSEGEVTEESVVYTEAVSEGDAKVNVLLTADQHEKFASEVVRNLEVAEKQGPLDVEEIASLVVTVTEIRFDGPTSVEENPEEKVPGGQHLVFEGARDVDIMHLREVSELISVANVPAGEYTKIRLHIENPRLWLVGDEDEDPRTDIQLTANGRLFVSESFTLVADKPNYVVLGFHDLHLVETGQGRFVFTPQLRADILVDEHTVLATGIIKNLVPPDDEIDTGWFTLELEHELDELEDTLTVEVSYSEATAVWNYDDPDPNPNLGVYALQEGMRVDVQGTLWPEDDTISALDIWFREQDGIITDLREPNDDGVGWFTLLLDEENALEIAVDDITEVFDLADPDEDLDFDDLQEGMSVIVHGWLEPTGDVLANTIEIVEYPVQYKGVIRDLDDDDPWFTLELDDESTVDVWYTNFTYVFDEVEEAEVDIGSLVNGMEIRVSGARWPDDTLSALEIQILVYPNDDED